MSHHELKKVSTEDLALLRVISFYTFIDTFGPDTPAGDLDAYMTQAYDYQQLKSELKNPDSHFYFLYYEEQLAGYLKINQGTAQSEPMPDNYFEIERIYVLPPFKRKGLGSYLVSVAEKKALEAGKDFIWLGVWEYNEKAQAFYEAKGFHRFSEHKFMMGSWEQTDWLLGKQIKA